MPKKNTNPRKADKKQTPKPGRKLDFESAQRMILAKYGPAFAKMAAHDRREVS